MKNQFLLLSVVAVSLSLSSAARADQDSAAVAPGNPTDFAPGSKLLEGALATTHFEDLFKANVLMDNDKTYYVFRISKEGVLCPLRYPQHDDNTGTPEFFSNYYENAACINIQDFAKTDHLNGEFHSEKNNSPRSVIDGDEEIDGIFFIVDAKSTGQKVTDGKISEVTMNLTFTGKSRKTHVWGEGSAKLPVKFSKNTQGNWIAEAQNKSDSNWSSFVLVKSHLSLSVGDKAGGLMGSYFGKSGSQKKPVTLNSDSLNFIK